MVNDNVYEKLEIALEKLDEVVHKYEKLFIINKELEKRIKELEEELSAYKNSNYNVICDSLNLNSIVDRLDILLNDDVEKTNDVPIEKYDTDLNEVNEKKISDNQNEKVKNILKKYSNI